MSDLDYHLSGFLAAKSSLSQQTLQFQLNPGLHILIIEGTVDTVATDLMIHKIGVEDGPCVFIDEGKITM